MVVLNIARHILFCTIFKLYGPSDVAHHLKNMQPNDNSDYTEKNQTEVSEYVWAMIWKEIQWVSFHKRSVSSREKAHYNTSAAQLSLLHICLTLDL